MSLAKNCDGLGKNPDELLAFEAKGRGFESLWAQSPTTQEATHSSEFELSPADTKKPPLSRHVSWVANSNSWKKWSDSLSTKIQNRSQREINFITTTVEIFRQRLIDGLGKQAAIDEMTDEEVSALMIAAIEGEWLVINSLKELHTACAERLLRKQGLLHTITRDGVAAIWDEDLIEEMERRQLERSAA
jgi:hypothetical protein